MTKKIKNRITFEMAEIPSVYLSLFIFSSSESVYKYFYFLIISVACLT